MIGPEFASPKTSLRRRLLQRSYPVPTMTVERINAFYAPRMSGASASVPTAEAQPEAAEITAAWARALIDDAVHARASDIHFDPQECEMHIRFRIDGTLHEIARLPQTRALHLLRYFKVAANLDPAASLLPEDSHFQFHAHGKALDIRVTCAPCVLGDKLAMRLLQKAAVKHRLSDLGLRDEDHGSVQQWLGDSSGMFLVGGPVGSGKTTTLYALLAELCLNERNIVTIEDPVEYQLEGVNQMEVNLKRGLTFERGLRSILRLDPDYILLGEIRDKESAVIAMEAASTGRIVLTTMHSRNVAGAVTALRSLGVSNYEIAASLAFIVGQRLVRKLCTHCRQPGTPTSTERQWLESLGEAVPEQAWHPIGCEDCAQTGYYGRTGLFELLPMEERVYDMIIGGQDEHTLRQHLRAGGFRPLLRDGLLKAAEGVTDYAELTRIGAQSYLDQSKRIRRRGRH